MNQILSVEMPKNKQNSYRNKNSKKADIRTIIIFFCIILILFALILTIIAFSIINKKKETESNLTPVITGTQPVINVEIQSDTILNIIVTHDKQISSISYNWNDGEKVEEIDIGELTKEIIVEVPQGTNTLNVNATDINGITSNFTNQYTGIQGPSIILEQQENQVKLTVQSDNTISYISYNWDGGEEKQIQVNDLRTEHLIEVLEGEHTLNIVVVDIEGQEATKSKTMIGDVKPSMNITKDNDNLYIEASDDQKLTKMTIEDYDTKEIQEFEINDKQFSKKIPLKDGESKLIIIVYNVNGLKNEQWRKVVK